MGVIKKRKKNIKQRKVNTKSKKKDANHRRDTKSMETMPTFNKIQIGLTPKSLSPIPPQKPVFFTKISDKFKRNKRKKNKIKSNKSISFTSSQKVAIASLPASPRFWSTSK